MVSIYFIIYWITYWQNKCDNRRESTRNHQWFDCIRDSVVDCNLVAVCKWDILRWLLQSDGNTASDSNTCEILRVIDATRGRVVRWIRRKDQFHHSHHRVSLPNMIYACMCVWQWIQSSGNHTINTSWFHFRDIEKIKSGLAEDVSHFLYLVFSFVISVTISFVYGWQLTLLVISYLPIVFIANVLIGKVSVRAIEPINLLRRTKIIVY